MSFFKEEKDDAVTNKQHLNLSLIAYDIVQSDMFAFKETKLSGFINTVFENYHTKAEASISRTLNALRGEFSKIMADLSADEKQKEIIINRLLLDKEEKIREKISSYGSGKTFKFWLNKTNMEYLNEPDSECEENKYYSSRGKYIKCVIEEYARLPYVEREKIYYNSFVESITYAINEEKQIRIVTAGDKVYSVYPYALLYDPLSIANYLVGYCKQYGFEEDSIRPCSFRVSGLKSVKVEKSKSAFLKTADRQLLSKTIAVRGVQFLAGQESEILVRLTEEGVFKLQRQVHLRPTLIEKRNDNKFLFKCTLEQAEFYFFKFGKDAEILSPEVLRNKFASQYSEAKNIYVK